MKKTLLITCALIASFALGFAFNKVIITKANNNATMKRVTGVGGIFFKCKDPGKLKTWYKAHLGINTDKYGAVFEWRQASDSTKKGYTQWSPFVDSTKYFGPSSQSFMLNYRVDNLDALVNALKNESVTIVDKVETYDYGKFVHILDLEGNKIELWEPNDVVYEKMGQSMGAETTK